MVSMAWVRLAIMVEVCLVCLLRPVGTSIDVTGMEAIIGDLTNSVLGHAYMQKYLNSLGTSLKSSPIDGGDLVLKLSNSLKENIKRSSGVVTKLRDNVVSYYDGYTQYPEYLECCKLNLPNKEYDSRFKTSVDREAMCYRQSKFNADRPTFVQATLLQQFQENQGAHAGLKWQYFGTEEGLMFTYPAKEVEHCDNYDPRIRPWYVETASPAPKDVVIVIDTSGSMKGGLLDIAKDAAKAVLETFNPNDRVNLVSFSTYAHTPSGSSVPGCFRDTLAAATPANKRILTQVVDGFTAQGGTQYNKAIRTAFGLFENTVDKGERERAILFLTDGAPNDSENEILRNIANKNAVYGNESVVLFTFGIGNVGQIGQTVLQKMAGGPFPSFRTGSGVLSYAYVIDQEGKALSHPLLPRPHYVSSDTVTLHIKELEQFPTQQHIINEILRKEHGNLTANSPHVLSIGEVFRGVKIVHQMTSYNWISVPGTQFKVCVVLARGETTYTWVEQSMSKVAFTYHQLNLTSVKPAQTCRHFQRLALEGQSAVKFAAKAFKDPFEYIDSIETVTNIRHYENIIKHGATNDLFSSGVLEGVLWTSKVHDVWFGNETDTSHVVWRTIATPQGVIRVTPGVTLNKHYDPTRRAWYRRTVAHPDKTVISAPYWDAFGAGYVVTVSKALLFPGTGDIYMRIAGVITVDVTVGYLHRKVMSSYPECQKDANSCFLVDSDGYFVIHKDFVTPIWQKKPDVENVYISQKDRGLSLLLTNDKKMESLFCNQLLSLEKLEFYHINSQALISSTDWDMAEVQGTNVFLGMNHGFRSQQHCVCVGETSRLPLACPASLHQTCQCPCYSKTTDYRHCEDEFVPNGVSFCIPNEAPVNMDSQLYLERNQIQNLDRCYDTRCEEQSTYDSCYPLSGCAWCFSQRRGYVACHYKEECVPCPYNEECAKSQDGNGGTGGANGPLIAGATSCAVVGLVVIIWVIVACCKRSGNPPPERGVAVSAAYNPAFLPEMEASASEPPPSYTKAMEHGAGH